MNVDIADLSLRWKQAWGDCPPIGSDLRGSLRDTWVRFHSLPGSKRYADTEDEYAELLHRHQAVIAELIRDQDTDTGADLLVVAASWSGGPEPCPLEAEVSAAMPGACYWTSALTDDSDPSDPMWEHLWVAATRLDDDHLARLLRLVADDIAVDVIVTSAVMAWLYHPYNGGADVIAATAEQRDQLRDRHREWLSRHPSGL